MRHRRGFSLLEVVVALLVLFVLAVAVAPAFSRSLVLDRVIWERRLALKVIETQLEKACDTAQTAAGFTGLATGVLAAGDFPQELTAASGTRTVVCVDGSLSPAACPTNLKRVQVRVEWYTRAQQTGLAAGRVDEQSADYVISKTGICGTGV